MKNTIKILIPIFLILGLHSCQDVISVDLDAGEPLVVVDAWLNNMSAEQKIILQYSQPYFDSISVDNINDATVQIITGSGNTIDFIPQGDGVYTWTPISGATIGPIGNTYNLVINTNETMYTASTTLNPVCEIDSIQQEFLENEPLLEDGIYTQFFARDLEGLGDTYWIKTFKNGMYLGQPLELNIAFDAAFNSGAEVDNIIFIPPIREGVNELDDENIPIAWVPGDIIKVEIHSISNEAFTFLEVARRQILNGLSTIFAEPLVNTDGNIKSSDGKEVLGFFNVAAVSSLEQVIE